MPKARDTIVFLTSDYVDYAKVTAEVVSSAAAKAGFGTLCVTGGELDADVKSEKAVCNGIYTLIERLDVAGLICESGMLGHRTGPDGVIRLLNRFQMPCISLGLDVPGRTSIVTDDALSMRRLMEHLINDSDCNRLAFVRGIPADVFSLERENIFRQTLLQHGRLIDESLFVTGNYDVFEAYDAVEVLLANHSGIDAIVCANDMMALGAARAVTAAGFNIPRDMVVSGFDDVPDATRHSPALTTVRQPLIEVAEIAVTKLLSLIHDPSRSDGYLCPDENRITYVSSELIVRGSTVAALRQESFDGDFDAVDVHRLLKTGMIGLKSPANVDLHFLARELEHTIKHGSTRFADHLKFIVSNVNSSDAHWWSNLCHHLEELGRCLIPTGHIAQRLPYIEAALICVRERVWALEMEREFAARRLDQMRSAMQLQIGSSTGMNEFLDVIDSWIRASRPRRFFLVCYDEPASSPRTMGRLLRAYRYNSIEAIPDGMFDTRGVLPNAFANDLVHDTLVLNPVYAGSDHFGYLMIDPDGIDLSQIDSAAHSIGNALRSHFLFEALESQAVRLQAANDELSTLANQDALTGLSNRLCFDRRLHELCASDDQDTNFALCFLDLDGFKMVNDVYGHAIGDELLKCIAERLKRIVDDIGGDRGFAARLGGDEFTVILISSNLEKELDRLAPALLAALSEQYWLAEHVVQISASIGAALFPENGSDTATLLRCADAAMYKAKSLGKNRFVKYSQDRDHVPPVQPATHLGMAAPNRSGTGRN